jgi:invasion protein IalB
MFDLPVRARALSRAGLLAGFASLAIFALNPGAQAQQPAPAPAQPRPAQPAQTQPRPAQPPAQAQPRAAQPAAPAAPTPADEGQSVTVVPTPWTKICNRDPESKKEICLVTQELRAETGQFLASVAVREIENDPKKAFIIAVPPGMLIQPGLRVLVDQQQPPVNARFAICFPNACYADVEINADFVNRMKRGQALTLQTINQGGRTVNFTMALRDFGKSYDGAPIDPRVVEEQQRKLQAELEERARKARESLLQRAPAGTPAVPAPTVTPGQPPRQ